MPAAKVRIAPLILAAAVLGLVGLRRAMEGAPRPVPGLAVKLVGGVREGGATPTNSTFAPDGHRADPVEQQYELPTGQRHWSSWNYSDDARGWLRLGPFAAPRVLALEVTGYPLVDGNLLALVDAADGRILNVAESNIGPRWTDVRLTLPAAWRGQQVYLLAVDNSGGAYGWVGVGVPRSVPWYAGWWGPFALRLSAFAAAGAVLATLVLAALRLLENARDLPPWFRPLAATALVALASYGLFWVYLANAAAGHALSWAMLAAALWIAARPGPSGGPQSARDDTLRPILLAVAIGAAYFGLLFLFGSERPMYDVAARRFCDTLAVDNQLPQMFASHLMLGEDPRNLAYGWWFSSERPPLQAACDLLVACPLTAAGFDLDTAAQSLGIWLQLAWVPAIWAWLRSLGTPARTSMLLLAALAPCGFFLVNTDFPWPKLLSASMVVGGYVLLLCPSGDPLGGGASLRKAGCSGGLMALGCLAHSGVAFSLIGLVPLAAFYLRPVSRPGLAVLGSAAASFILVMLPWLAYQHWYDARPDFLVKWHLGGVMVRDSRSVWAALAASYRAQTFWGLVHTRLINLGRLVEGPWREWLLVSGSDQDARRRAEYYSTFFAIGWWNLGFVAALLLRRGKAVQPGARVHPGAGPSAGLAAAFLWCALTLAVWVLLMFLPQSTVIHQGSYVTLLVLFPALALALWRLSPALLVFVSLAGLVNFLCVWLPPASSRPGTLHPGAACVAAMGALGLAALVLSSFRATD